MIFAPAVLALIAVPAMAEETQSYVYSDDGKVFTVTFSGDEISSIATKTNTITESDSTRTRTFITWNGEGPHPTGASTLDHGNELDSDEEDLWSSDDEGVFLEWPSGTSVSADDNGKNTDNQPEGDSDNETSSGSTSQEAAEAKGGARTYTYSDDSIFTVTFQGAGVDEIATTLKTITGSDSTRERTYLTYTGQGARPTGETSYGGADDSDAEDLYSSDDDGEFLSLHEAEEEAASSSVAAAASGSPAVSSFDNAGKAASFGVKAVLAGLAMALL